MNKFRRIVFICMDNTCRSIMAEAVMQGVQAHLPAEEQVLVISRGLVVLFSEPLNPKVIEILKENQLSVSKEATEELRAEDVGNDALLLTMTEQEKRMTQERFPTALNLYTLREFVGEQGDIKEPYGGTYEDYVHMYEHMDLMVKMAVQRLRA